MDVLTILAWAAIAVAAIYLVVALATLPQRRRLRREQEVAERDGLPVVHINEGAAPSDEPTPDRMRRLAGTFSAIATRVWSEPFDFTIESVAAVDRAILSGWGDDAPETDPDVRLAFGAYLGEVLVRRTRGRWVSGYSETDPASVLLLLPGREDAVNFSPFLLVEEKFTNPYGVDLPIAFTALEQKLKELQAA